MKIRFIILAFLISYPFSGYAQTIIDTIKSNLQKSPYSYSKLEDDLSVSKQKHIVKTYVTNLDFGAKTLNCYFIGLRFRYKLTAHYSNDTIFSLEILKLYEETENSVYKSEFQYLDSAKTAIYIKSHNYHYTSNSKISDFFSQHFERFGYACGSGVYTPESMIDCLAMIKSKDRERLLFYASSVNPTDRAYGVTGLYILKRKGIKLNIAEQNIIKLNQKSIAAAHNCMGCIDSTYPLNKLLDNSMLESYYDWYKRTGKLY